MSCHCLVSFYLLIQAVGWGGHQDVSRCRASTDTPDTTAWRGLPAFCDSGAFTSTCVVTAAALLRVLIAAALSEKQEAVWSCEDIQDVGGSETLRHKH